MYRLIFQNGPWRGRGVSVRAGELLIGSGTACDLRLPSCGLAERHARLRLHAGGVELEALGGAPVRVNGLAPSDAPLRDGDRLSLGELVLVYRAPGAAGKGAKRRPSPQRWTAALILLALAVQAALMIQGRLRALSRAAAPAAAPAAVPVPEPADAAGDPEESFFEPARARPAPDG